MIKIHKIFYEIEKVFSDARIYVKDLFSPKNVIKCTNLSRSWCDRDHLMFHAMFQILVDFVELEQPFVDWGSHSSKRFKDIGAMKQWNERHYKSQEGIEEMIHSIFDRDEVIAYCDKVHKINAEIIYLYEWYTSKKYDFDAAPLKKMTGEKISIEQHNIKHVKTGEEQIITWQEFHEAEDEHNLICDNMLYRILAIRQYLWT